MCLFEIEAIGSCSDNHAVSASMQSFLLPSLRSLERVCARDRDKTGVPIAHDMRLQIMGETLAPGVARSNGEGK